MTRKPYQSSVGSISHGTLRTRDLLESFADELERCKAEGEHANMIAEARAVILLDDAGGYDVADSEAASDLVNSLHDALNEYAPAFCYFGNTEGDGSDFGFWPSMEQIEELPRVSDPSEVEGLGTECAFVNDHGNVTVYGADGRVLLDIV